MVDIKKSFKDKKVTKTEVVGFYEAECCRCGCVNGIEESVINISTPLINEVTLSSLNYKGEIIPSFGNRKYYICDDCWNDLLAFLDRMGRDFGLKGAR